MLEVICTCRELGVDGSVALIVSVDERLSGHMAIESVRANNSGRPVSSTSALVAAC